MNLTKANKGVGPQPSSEQAGKEDPNISAAPMVIGKSDPDCLAHGHSPLPVRLPRGGRVGRTVALGALAIVLPFAFGACQAVPIATVGGPLVDAGPDPGPVRYADEVFSSVSVTTEHVADVTDSVGAPVSLSMDIYQPDGDTVTDRPVVLFVHGGGWTGGSRGDAVEVDQASMFARHGFVTISVDYRLDSFVSAPFDFTDSATTAAVMNGRNDVEAAITQVRAESAALGIDPARIHLVGRDSGATAAIAVGFDSAYGAVANGVTTIVSIGGGGSTVLVDTPRVRVAMVQGYTDDVFTADQADGFCSVSVNAGGNCDVVRVVGGHDLDAPDADTAAVFGITNTFLNLF